MSFAKSRLIGVSVVFVWVFSVYGLLEGHNAIKEENSLAGSDGWWYPQTSYEPRIKGFSTSISYEPGETVELKVECFEHDLLSAADFFTIHFYRLGFYSGKGAREIGSANVSSADCTSQPPCKFEQQSRMTDCSNWKVVTTFQIPEIAVSGVYVALPQIQAKIDEREKLFGTYIPFVVRRKGFIGIGSSGYAGSDILFKTSDITWVAYNSYGGYNLYRGNASYSFDTRAYKASYDRPFDNRLLAPRGNYQNFLFGTEYPMLYWLEENGYDVSYVSNIDVQLAMDQKKNFLDRAYHRVLLSVGHDEYWSQATKDAFVMARNNGVSLGFFSGNEGFWRVILTYASALTEKSTQSSYRVVVCRKETIDNFPPTTPDDWTGTFQDPRHRRPDPENALTGQLFMVNAWRNDSMLVSHADARMRFWRNCSNLWVSTEGEKRKAPHHTSTKHTSKFHHQLFDILGYEWDIHKNDCYRPEGQLALSQTKVHINSGLMELHGASYRGSGTAVHKLSLYRYHKIEEAGSTTMLSPNIGIVEMDKICGNFSFKEVDYRKIITSLVFGAGTVQWSWGLSDLHDGLHKALSKVIQQATVNILADMNASGTSPATAITIFEKTTDFEAPKTKITLVSFEPVVDHARQDILGTPAKTNHVGKYSLLVRGVSADFGGGRVGSVEVSMNGGKDWSMAFGKEHWYFPYMVEIDTEGSITLAANDHHTSHRSSHCRDTNRIVKVYGKEGFGRSKAVVAAFEEHISQNQMFDPDALVCSKNITSNICTTNVSVCGLNIAIVARAIDDNGWIERNNYNGILCDIQKNIISVKDHPVGEKRPINPRTASSRKKETKDSFKSDRNFAVINLQC